MVQEKESGLAGAHVAMSQNRVRTFSSVMNGSRFPAMQGNNCAGERERPMNGVAFVSRTKVSNDVDATTDDIVNRCFRDGLVNIQTVMHKPRAVVPSQKQVSDGIERSLSFGSSKCCRTMLRNQYIIFCKRPLVSAI